MQTIDIDPAAALDAFAVLALNVDPHVELGRPIIAQRHPDGTVQFQCADPDAWWWLAPDGTASRFLPLTDERAESTVWHRQVERSRVIGTAR